YVFFRGRRDDMFKVRGASVYPIEVEAALATLPMVERAFVIKIEHDLAPAVGAVVVPAPDARCGGDDLVAGGRARLSALQRPSRWRVIGADEVPTMPTGKVDQLALRRLLANDSPAAER